MIELTDVVFDLHRETMRLANESRGGPCAHQATGINAANLFLTKGCRDFFGLAHACIAERSIRGALATALKIPIGGSVSY